MVREKHQKCLLRHQHERARGAYRHLRISRLSRHLTFKEGRQGRRQARSEAGPSFHVQALSKSVVEFHGSIVKCIEVVGDIGAELPHIVASRVCLVLIVLNHVANKCLHVRVVPSIALVVQYEILLSNQLSKYVPLLVIVHALHFACFARDGLTSSGLGGFQPKKAKTRNTKHGSITISESIRRATECCAR